MKIPENLWLQDIKKTEYIFLAVKSIAVILLITYVFYESFLPIFFMIPIWVIYARDGLRDLCRKKEKEFRVQFSNAIQAMGAALKAGYSVENAIREAEKGYMTYDFFLPGLVIDAIENKRSKYLAAWAKELVEKKINTVNMLGCHDGIPMLDLKGILPEEDIQKLIALIVDRGGMVKNLHGQKNVYYQVNATYFSALGESEQKLLLARAIQIFMPGKPQVWYLDLFAGKNDHEAVKEAGEGGHKEINRTNLTDIQIRQGLQTDVVQKQLELLRFRSTSRAFTEDADIQIQSDGRKLMIRWSNSAAAAQLDVDFETGSFVIS